VANLTGLSGLGLVADKKLKNFVSSQNLAKPKALNACSDPNS